MSKTVAIFGEGAPVAKKYLISEGNLTIEAWANLSLWTGRAHFALRTPLESGNLFPKRAPQRFFYFFSADSRRLRSWARNSATSLNRCTFAGLTSIKVLWASRQLRVTSALFLSSIWASGS